MPGRIYLATVLALATLFCSACLNSRPDGVVLPPLVAGSSGGDNMPGPVCVRDYGVDSIVDCLTKVASDQCGYACLDLRTEPVDPSLTKCDFVRMEPGYTGDIIPPGSVVTIYTGTRELCDIELPAMATISNYSRGELTGHPCPGYIVAELVNCVEQYLIARCGHVCLNLQVEYSDSAISRCGVRRTEPSSLGGVKVARGSVLTIIAGIQEPCT